jgi:Uma2 family endonuclease
MELPMERPTANPNQELLDVYPPCVVQLLPVLEMSDDQFYEFAQLNRDLRMERNARGDLIIMPPTGFNTGDKESEIIMQLRLWAKKDGTGTASGPSTGFRLPNKAVRAPDASWIRNTRLAQLTNEQLERFIPLCPDFVIELRSPTDSLTVLSEKMAEFIENGTQLGWLIDPQTRRVHVYRPALSIDVQDCPASISGEPELPGFELDLREIWQP